MTRRVAIDARKFDDFGIGTTIRGIIGGLAAIAPESIEVHVIGPSRIRDRIPSSPIFRFVEQDAPHYSLRELHQISRAAERAGADLLHMPHYVTPATSLPLVTTIHDLIHLRVPRRDLPLGGRIYARWMIRRAVDRSAAIVTVSEAVRGEIERLYPEAQGRITVIPNGVPETSSPPVPFDDREPFLLFAGNDKPHKNVDRLVEAFGIVRSTSPELRLVLVGGTFDRFANLPGVEPHGFVSDDELLELYRRTTALVQPSLHEGFGLPVAEAMSHGTPVIVSAIPPLLEIASDAAIVIEDPTAVASIARALEAAMNDPSIRERSARLGPGVSGRFRWPAAARSLVDLWTKLL